MAPKIKDVNCPACGGELEIVKGVEPIIHCNNCGRDWETGLVPYGKEMQVPEKFNMREIIDSCKKSHEKLGYTKEEIQFKGFRLYFDAQGTIISNGFFMRGFDPDACTDE